MEKNKVVKIIYIIIAALVIGLIIHYFINKDFSKAIGLTAKISLLIIGYALVYLIIKAYYRNNNIRFPYENWDLGWKKDVTFREKLIVSALMQVPFFVIIVFGETIRSVASRYFINFFV